MSSSLSSTPPLLIPNNKRTKKIERIKELKISQQDEGILTIQINRPQVKNALNRNAVYELIAAIEGATNNSAIKVVVITGVGDIYTAGNDLKQVLEYKDYERSANYVLRALIKTFIVCTKLLVCLVNGPCIGIGFTLACLCDAVYCTNNAYFQTPFTQLGICPEACSSLTFPYQFGKSWSTNLLMFGEKLSAEKALQLGFVLDIFATPVEVEQKFWPKMLKYAKLPAESLKVTKKLIKVHHEEELLRAMNLELKEIEILRHGPVYQKVLQNYKQKTLSKL